MSSNEPKKQHYIPQLLLRNFCDCEGCFWVGDRETDEIRRTIPRRNFVIKDLYTRNNLDADTGDLIRKDYKYEEAFRELESAVAPVIQEIIRKARSRKYPKLSKENSDLFKRFILSMARRTPESQQRLMASKNFEDMYYLVAKEQAEQLGHPLPDKDSLFQDLQIVRLMQKTEHNVDARFAAGDESRLVQEEEKFCRETGLWIGVIGMIGIPKRSFVIDSHGITIFRLENNKQGCLPIAHDVVVMASPHPGRESLRTLGRERDWLIRKINMTTTSQSQWIAGRSEQLIRSLTH